MFERHARGIAPTPYGDIVARHARAILAELEQVQEEIASLKSGLSGQASVGVVATPPISCRWRWACSRRSTRAFWSASTSITVGRWSKGCSAALLGQAWILPPPGSVLRDDLARVFMRQGLLAVLIDDLGVTVSPFGVITRRRHKLSPGAQALLDAIRTTARTLYPVAPAPAPDAADAFTAHA